MLKTIILLFFIPFSLWARTVEQSNIDFNISPDSIGNNIYYSIQFASYKDILPDVLKLFDVEDFKNGENQFVFSKSTFLINKKLEDIDRQSFVQQENLERVLDAKMLRDNGNNSWDYEMTIAVKSIRFKLNVAVDDRFEPGTLVGLYSNATDLFDTNLEQRSYFVTQVLDHFTTGLKRMVVVSKLIPHGDQTLVVSYHLTVMNYKWYKKYNIFHVIDKMFTKKVLSSLSLTRSIMLEDR